MTFFYNEMDGGRNLKQPNVEQPIVRNFEISNIKRTKDELYDFFYFRIYFLFLFLFELFELKIYGNI